MRKFILKSFVFTVPALLLFIMVELFITFSSNTFRAKSRFLKKNVEDIQVLILGSSHHQNALNPEYFDLKTVNIAYGGQDIQLDSSLFFKYVHKMKSLKTVIIEYDYLTFNNKVDKDYFRLPWYYRFYAIETFKLSLKSKHSMYLSSPVFFNNLIKEKLNLNSYKYLINNNGFIKNDFPGVFKTLNYDSLKLIDEYKKEIYKVKKSDSTNNFKFNKNKLNSIIAYCIGNNINVILSSPPIYFKNEDFEVKLKREMMNYYIDSVSNGKSIKFLDFQSDKRFKVKDFKNFTHLNSNGAKKYSKIFNEYIN